MKYLKYLFILLFIPFIVFAENKKIEIKSIELVEKSDDVEELEKATFKDLKLNFSLIFVEQDNYAKYNITIKNNGDKDYEIDSTSTFDEKQSIRYDYEVDNNSKILKANEELNVNVIITYVKELDDSEFDNGIFKETNKVSLELVNANEVRDKPIIKMVTNPNTSTGYIILVIFAIVLSLLVFILVKNKKSKLLIIFFLLTIPLTVLALEKIKIEIETYIEIRKGFTGFINRYNDEKISDNSKVKIIKKYCIFENCYDDEESCNEASIDELHPCQEVYTLESDSPHYEYCSYLKHKVVNDTIIETYVCSKGKDYCVLGGKNIKFDEEKENFITTFSSKGCILENEDTITCTGDKYHFKRDGSVLISEGCGYCSIDSNGISRCHSDGDIC